MIEVRQPDARNLIRCITFAWLCSYALKSRNNSALAFQSVRHTNCAKAQDSRSHLRGRIHLCASVQNEISDQIRSGSVPGTTCGFRTTPKAVQTTSMGSTRISFHRFMAADDLSRVGTIHTCIAATPWLRSISQSQRRRLLLCVLYVGFTACNVGR